MVQISMRLDRIMKKMYVQSKSYDEVSKLVKANSNMLASIPAIQPIANNDLKRLASGFGFRVHPIYKTRKMHTGMDFTASIGTEIYATGDGVVKEIKADGGYGNHVILNHGYGYQTLYAHLSRFGVRAGQKIKRGDIVGYVGNTGRSTGPHLHYEVIKNGAKINPVNFYYNDLTPADYERMAQLAEIANQSFD
jgi:murein DD-endopeptidase MepM/ murein hydrolase activator NlpD